MTQEKDSKQNTFFRLLLNSYHKENPESLLKSMPPAEAKEIINCKVPAAQDLSSTFLQPSEILEPVHYSWFAELIKNKPASLKPFYIASLPEQKAASLRKLLKIQAKPLDLPYSLKKYLCLELYKDLQFPAHLPASLLPESTFFMLLQFTKTKLVEIIDFLGIYDLAEEMRNIVDTRNLKNIYACLSPKKQQFLRIVLHQKEKITALKLKLDTWDGNCPELHKLLHRRGIFRLGKALASENPDFLWHFTYILDTGRGKILADYYANEEAPNVTQALGFQLLNLINFLEQGSP